MNRIESVQQAFVALRANKLRASLTMLGVIIGVGAMVVMVAVVAGLQTLIQRQLEGLGARLIFVLYQPDESRAAARQTAEGLQLADVRAIRRECDRVADVCAEMDLGEVKAGSSGQERSTHAVAAEPAYVRVHFLRVARGRFLDAGDMESWKPVCVLGAQIAAKLFLAADPLGHDVTLRGVRFTVVGTLASKAAGLGENFNDRVYVPLTTVHKRITGSDQVSAIFAQARSTASPDAGMEQIWRTLMRLHDNRPDYTVDSEARLADTLRLIMVALGVVLSGIAGLSLLVGGIGIMNVMLVSVTERTREIGIRKAVGARRRDILWQFLVEAMTLSGAGGLVGVVLGYLIAGLVAAVAGERLPASVPGWAAVLGFGFSVAVGIAAGGYPALRAASLDPIEALRWE